MFKNRYSPRENGISAQITITIGLYKYQWKISSSSILTQSVIKTYAYSFTINLRGFGISVIDNLPRELLFCSIEDVFVSTNYDKSHNRISASIGDLQIDNQLHSTNFPVFLFTGRKSCVNSKKKGRLSGVSVDNTITGSPPRANTLVGNALSCDLVSKRTTEITHKEIRPSRATANHFARIAFDSEEDNIIHTAGANGKQ